MTFSAGGLGHAFQTAYNLVDQVNLTGAMPTGAARAVNPSATAVPGSVPQQMINTGAVLRASSTSNLPKVVTLANASGLTIDANNNVWASAANTTSPSISQWKYANSNSSNGSATADFSTGAVAGLATDGNGDLFGITGSASGNSVAIYLNNTGTLSTPSYSPTGYSTATFGTGGGFWIAPAPYTSQLAGAYFPLNGELASAGSLAQYGTTLYTGPTETASASAAPHRSQMDGAGDVYWTDHEATGLLYIYMPSANYTVQTGSYTSLLPCYPVADGSGYSCASAANLGAPTCAAWPSTAPAVSGWPPTRPRVSGLRYSGSWPRPGHSSPTANRGSRSNRPIPAGGPQVAHPFPPHRRDTHNVQPARDQDAPLAGHTDPLCALP